MRYTLKVCQYTDIQSLAKYGPESYTTMELNQVHTNYNLLDWNKNIHMTQTIYFSQRIPQRMK